MNRLNVSGFGHDTLVDQGEGKPLLCVHGGPGMDFSYMLPLLPALAERHRTVYYEQHPHRNEPLKPTFCAVDQVDELEKLGSALHESAGAPISVLAHSWGSYLVLEALSRGSVAVEKVLLINPLPLTWQRLRAAGGRLVERVRPDQMSEIDRLEQAGTEEAGKELMDLVGYAYLAPGNRDKIHLDVNRYHPGVNAQVLGSVENYDQRDIAEELARRLPVFVIYGDSDYIEPRDTEELAAHIQSTVLRDCGHFPFVEQPRALRESLLRYLSD